MNQQQTTIFVVFIIVGVKFIYKNLNAYVEINIQLHSFTAMT